MIEKYTKSTNKNNHKYTKNKENTKTHNNIKPNYNTQMTNTYNKNDLWSDMH